MNAYEIPNLRFSLPAGEDIARRRFVSVNSSSEGVIATAAGSAIGVSMNEAADGEVLDIADGIVVVEAGGAIAAGADVEVGANGKAVAKTTGIGVGVAITGATGAGQFVAVKLMSVSNANGADGEPGFPTQTITYTASDLEAGVDLTGVVLGAAIGESIIGDVCVISLGNAEGIDNDNTSTFEIKVGNTTKASKTFNTSNPFPASGSAVSLDLSDDDIAVSTGDVLLLDVTNGDNANLPAFIVQVVTMINAFN